MIPPRWRKTARDIWNNKTRTALVVLAIAVGVAAFGVLATSRVVLTENMAAEYAAINPASATLAIPSFDDDLLRMVRALPDIAEAEGRRTFQTRLWMPARSLWVEFDLTAFRDYEDIRVNAIGPEQGAWPPGRREVLLEQSVSRHFGIQIGDFLQIELPDGTRRELTVSGIVHDLNQTPANLIPSASGYVSAETAEWLGQPPGYDQLDVVVSTGRDDRAHIEQVMTALKARLERDGYRVQRTAIPPPLKHPLQGTLETVNYLLLVLSVISYVLSGFLIYNTMAAIMAGQVRQIGVMKAVGAGRVAIFRMYIALALVFGVLALGVALPVGVIGARLFCAYAASMINFDIASFQTPGWVLAMQVAMALLAPVTAALYPIGRAAAITVREALADYGISQAVRKTDWIDRAVERIRGLPRPLLLSLRNTFRQRLRLMLTLIPLAIAGATFIAVFGVRASLLTKVNEVLGLYHYDVSILMDHPYRARQLEAEVERIPGVVDAEAWATAQATIIYPDGTEGPSINLLAPPYGSSYVQAPVNVGRWLAADDQNAIVVGEDLLNDMPGYAVGDMITLEIQGRSYQWQIIGRTVRTGSAGTGPGTGLHLAFVNYEYLARILDMRGAATLVAIKTDTTDPDGQAAVGRAVEEHLKRIGLTPIRVRTIQIVAADMTLRMNVLIGLMLIMAILLAAVGALGLTGTMSLNVLERTREIGVIRAIGAGGAAIRQIVVVEGVVIAIIGWGLGVLLSIPLTRFLANSVGLMFINERLPVTFAAEGVGFWLGLSIVIAALASAGPAYRAARLSVREALAYE